MILYKGNSLVVGKHFVLEGEVLEYQGKAFGDFYDFTSKDGVHMILDRKSVV